MDPSLAGRTLKGKGLTCGEEGPLNQPGVICQWVPEAGHLPPKSSTDPSGLNWKAFFRIAHPVPTEDVEIPPWAGSKGRSFLSISAQKGGGVSSAFRPSTHYPWSVGDLGHPSFIPAEAQARQARLASALAAMARGENLEPAPLQALRQILFTGRPEGAGAIIEAVTAADLAEEALDLLRSARRDGADLVIVKAVAAPLEPLAARAQVKREAGWQLDTQRTAVRVAYAKEGPALDFDDGDLHALFLQAFRLEGFRLALDLGKRPRPMLRVELPLPAGAGGLSEWLELSLRKEPAEPAGVLLARLNTRLPEGLRVHGWEPHAPYASPLGELALAAHWHWTCPQERAEGARVRAAAFLAASEWVWEKGGKVEGRKQAKLLDLRPLVTELRWEGDSLRGTTSLAGAEATNPLKIFAAILGLEPSDLRGLLRCSLSFRADPRLAQAERFEPKLKNMYEDAVLLGGGSNITVVEEDDDEPIRLGGPD